MFVEGLATDILCPTENNLSQTLS